MNVHDIFGGKKDEDDNDDENTRFAGGIDSRGGGSGMAVLPNTEDGGGDDAAAAGGARDNVFRLAEGVSAGEAAAGGGEGGEVRRTITMYRNGFVVDDGPYRRLDDPANKDFLRSLAQGKTPKELVEGSNSGDITVGLVDKRSEEYVEKFKSFSGEGTSLGGSASASTDGNIDPATLPSPPPAVDAGKPTTSIAVRLLNGKRKVVKINLDATVSDLAANLRDEAESNTFRLLAGFPPAALKDLSQTIEEAGLKGAQVSMSKA